MSETGSESTVEFKSESLLPPEVVEAPPPELMPIFGKYEQQIRELYSQVDQWHGLGRYKVTYHDDNRTEFKEVQDVLSSIIDQGIVPQPDNFQGRLFPRGTHQISTTHSRPYASMYAYHHDINNVCRYRFHNDTFWTKTLAERLGRTTADIFWAMTLAKSAGKNIPKVVLDEWKKNGMQGVKETRPVVNRRGKVKDVETWKKKVDPTIMSDDYPMLVGLREGAVDPVRTSWTISASHEKRSHKVIPVDQFTHIEVPLDRMEETQALLTEKGIDLPLIPLEAGEIYSTRYNPRDLIGRNPFKQPR